MALDPRLTKAFDRSFGRVGAVFVSVAIMAAACSVSEDKAPEAAEPFGPSSIRVRNNSDKTLEDLVIRRRPFGTVKPGDFTEYQDFPSAYSYAKVTAAIDGDAVEFVPDDYLGAYSGIGEFTYEIWLVDVRGAAEIRIGLAQ